MPRKKQAQSPDVQPVVDKINQFILENAVSVNKLATVAGVTQPSLLRFLKGHRKTVTDDAKKVVETIDNWHNNNYPNVLDINTAKQSISDAALRLWDGDPSTAEQLAKALDLLQPAVHVLLKKGAK